MGSSISARTHNTALAERIRGLRGASVAELQELYVALHGVESRSRNRAYLWKRTAWKMQELEEGGLAKADLARVRALAPTASLRSRPPRGALRAIASASQRDPRLPPPDSVLTKAYGGERHEVTVLEDGFLYRGARYASLSRIARVITGAAWNGFLWFGLTPRSPRKER